MDTTHHIKDILTLTHKDRSHTVQFVRGEGVICEGLLPRTGSAAKVAEAVWMHRDWTMTYHAPEIIKDIKAYMYVRDLYNIFNVEYQRWNRP